MKNNTDVDYRNAIKAKYETEKSGDFHGFLDNPSPAQLREFCLLKFDNGLNKIDESIFRMYFKVSESENLRDSIYNYHIPKFKTLQSFLVEDDKKTNILNLNLIAVLVDFNPRPFNKFSKEHPDEPVNPIKAEAEKIKEENKEIETKKNSGVHFIEKPLKTPVIKTKSWSKKAALLTLIIIIIFSVGFTIKHILIPKKECMQWQKDHYEPIDCQSDTNGFFSSAPVVPYDEDCIDLQKLEVCDTTTFFIGQKALVWYCKVNGKIEYFDGPGYHPITNKVLKPITPYMINKYIKGK